MLVVAPRFVPNGFDVGVGDLYPLRAGNVFTRHGGHQAVGVVVGCRDLLHEDRHPSL